MTPQGKQHLLRVQSNTEHLWILPRAKRAVINQGMHGCIQWDMCSGTGTNVNPFPVSCANAKEGKQSVEPLFAVSVYRLSSTRD